LIFTNLLMLKNLHEMSGLSKQVRAGMRLIRYGVSRERVRKVEKGIIGKMRDFLKCEIPDFGSYTDNAIAWLSLTGHSGDE